MDRRLGPWKERALVKVSCVVMAPGNSAAVCQSGAEEGFFWSRRRPGTQMAGVKQCFSGQQEPGWSRAAAHRLPLPGDSDSVGELAHHPHPAPGLWEEDVRIGRLGSCHLPGENYCSRRTLQELGKRPELET